MELNGVVFQIILTLSLTFSLAGAAAAAAQAVAGLLGVEIGTKVSSRSLASLVGVLSFTAGSSGLGKVACFNERLRLEKKYQIYQFLRSRVHYLSF